MKEGNELRKKKLALRDALTTEDIEKKSRMIAEKILQLEEIQKALNIFIYVSFRSEVDTHGLIGRLMQQGKRISVPITHLKEKYLQAIHIEDPQEDLVSGYQGILEPHRDRVMHHVTEPQNLDVVIVPGSVFDERGGRFGYGGGYYDKYLQNIPFAVRIGLAFEVQMVKEAPLQPHDELVHYVITEDRVIDASSILRDV